MTQYPTPEDLRQAFLAHRRQRGQQATLDLIKSLTGTNDLDAVPEERREELIGILHEGSAIPRPVASLDPVSIFAKWNSAGRGRGRGRDGGDHE